MSAYSDSVILTQIKKGDKDVLIHLYKTFDTIIKKDLLAKGASEEDVQALLEDVLVHFWMLVQSDQFVLNEGLRIQMPQLANELWHQRLALSGKEDEDHYILAAEKLKKFINTNTAVKYVSYNRGKVGVSVPLFALASIAVVWLVLEYKPVEIRTIAKLIKIPSYIYFNKNKDTNADSLLKADANYRVTAYASPAIKANQNDSLTAKDSSAIVTNTDPLFLTSDEGQSNDSLREEEIVVRKDMLLSVTTLKVTDKSGATADAEEKSLAKELAEKMNPEAKVPDYESKIAKSYQVEFWKSPVNFRGYKMSKNKIVLFGLEESDGARLYSHNDNLYINFHQNFFKLEEADDFEPFNKVKENAVLTLLK
jgi:hypothetical protein